MKGQRKLTASAMALLLAASFLSFSWSAPQAHFQRRNWTPQAMLYLKGAQISLFKAILYSPAKRLKALDCTAGEKKSEDKTVNSSLCTVPPAEGRRFISGDSQRKDLYDRMRLETRSQNTNPLSLSEAAALFLGSLWKAQEEVEEENSDHPGYLRDNLSNW